MRDTIPDTIIIERTRRWLSSTVIGLNLCPFAKRVFDAELIRYVVTEAADEENLLQAFSSELTSLANTPITSVETTLLIHPQALVSFDSYLDFLVVAEQRIRQLGLRGIIQLASFHPAYQFAGTEPDAVENYTNRSPYPMLHLLREESISKVANDPRNLLAIPERNQQTMRSLGERIVRQLKEIQES